MPNGRGRGPRIAVLAAVCAAGVSAPALIPGAQAQDPVPTETVTETTPTDTTPTQTTPTETTPTETTPTETTPTETTPTETTPTETTPTQTTPAEDPPPAEDERPWAYPPALPPGYVPPPEPGSDPDPEPTTPPAPAPAPKAPTAASAPPPERCRDANARLSAGAERVAAALRCLVDAERYGYGLERLAPEARLDVAAANHAQDMAARGFFGHTAPDPAPFGPTVADRVRNAGYDAAVWGENLAAGQRTAAEVVDAWMASPGHRTELLDPRFTEMGLGFATGSDGRVRWAQVFGRPQGVAAPQHPRRSVAAKAASRALTAEAERRGRKIVVRGELAGRGRVVRRIRITALKGTSVRSRTISVRPGRRFAASVARPARTGVVRVLVRVVGTGSAPLRLTV